MEISGSQVRKFRKAAGLDQGTVAKKLGISGSKLCRIETEDKSFPAELLDRLYSVLGELNPNSPLALSAARITEIEAEEAAAEKERQRQEKLRNLPSVETLGTIGKTYRYKDFIVVPSQYYARWSGQEIQHVNQAIERLAMQNRLEIGEHFFKLTYEEARLFVDITKCDIELQGLTKGLVLITYSAVNRLTHHFQDPNSVARSNLITDTYTYQNPVDGRLHPLAAQILSPREQIRHLVNIGSQFLELDQFTVKLAVDVKEGLRQVESQIQETDTKLAAKIDATDAKLDAKIEETKSEIDEKISQVKVNNGASVLDRDQTVAINRALSAKNIEYGHGSVNGMVLRQLKIRFDLGSKDTYKGIASRDFEDALQFIKNWIPSPAQMKTIQDRIAEDKAKKEEEREEKRLKKEAKVAKKKEIFQQATPQPMQVTKPIEPVIIPPRSGGIWQVVNPPRF